MDPSKHKAFALTKISRPRGNRPLLRPRLFERLDEFRNASMIWLTGPPGAGKTTLISSYLTERRLASLWVQLDADDASVATFFYYLGLAVQQATARADLVLPSLTPEYLPGLMSFTRRYAQTIAAGIAPPAVIVLDDYEQVPAQALLHEVVRELASALPQGFNLVVLSRTEPPPAYARLRLHQDFVVLDGRELNLTRDEAFSLALAREPHPRIPSDAARIEHLLLETQGWIAGFTLLLAEGSDPDQPGLSGKTQQLLFDYFANELFGRFDPPMQKALLRTALLPAMTISDAEKMSGDPAVGPVLAELHRQNCFVAQRGQTSPVYEYHALFRAFLLNRAAALIPADEWRMLQRRAAALLAETRQADAAAGLYRAAQDWQGLSALALREAPALILAGRHRTLEQWLSGIPGGTFRQAPWLYYWRAMARMPFDPVAARGILEQAYKGFRDRDDAIGLYSTWAGAMESFFFESHDFTPADPWVAEFEGLRARHPEFPSRAVELRTYWAMGTLLHRQPHHPLLPGWSERALALLDPSDRDLSVLLGGYLIIWFLWRGEAAEARSVIERIVPWLEQNMSAMVLILWSCAVALYHSVQGETEGCRKSVEEGLGLAQSTGLQAFDFLLCAQMARCCLVAGDPAEAETWMATMAGTMRSHSHLNGAFYRHLRSNAAAQRGDWQQALEHARSGMAMALESGVPFVEAHCHIDLARALLGGGDDTEWAAHIDAARTIGQAMGSRVVDYLCLEAEAAAAFKHGREALGLDRLAKALALSRAMDGATWLMAGPQASARLYDHALAAGIEIDHVRRLIRRHRLTPPEPAMAAESWPWPVRIHALGGLAVVVEEEPLMFQGKAQRKPLELLGAVVASAGRGVSSGTLMAQLWPELEGDAERNAFDLALHRLRKLLRWDDALSMQDGKLRLNETHVWVDVWAFERMCGVVERLEAEHASMDKEAIGSLARRLLQLYPGHFLAHEEAGWALAARERLRSKFVRGVSVLGRWLERNEAWEEATALYRRGIELDTLSEEFHRRLMQSYHAQGRIAEALDAYRHCRDLLSITLGVQPCTATQAAYRALKS